MSNLDFTSRFPDSADSERQLLARNMAARVSSTVLASAARTATTTTANLRGNGFEKLLIHINVTAASGTGGLTLRVVAVDPITGASSGYCALTGAMTAIGHRTLAIGPGFGAVSGASVVSAGAIGLPLPDTFQIQVLHGDASSYTYSVAIERIA
jgi:hypothetical protein